MMSYTNLGLIPKCLTFCKVRGNFPRSNPKITIIMKKHFFILIAFSLVAGVSCEQKIDTEKEKEAIIALLQDEKDGFTNMDIDQWSRNVLQDSSYTWIGASSGQYWLSNGYSEHKEWIEKTWSNWDPNETRDRIDFEVLKTRITPDAAWVLIDVGNRIEALFLEKTENTWIISLQAIVVTSSYEGDEVAVEETSDPDTE
jgi:hypothetical protein